MAKRRSASKKAPGPPAIREIQDAVDRGRDRLGERHDYYGFLARQDATRGAPELARHLRGDLLAKQDRDGSWGDGDLGVSTDALWLLLDLGMAAGSAPVTRGLNWLYDRRGEEGSYGSGCTPAKHEQRLCEHYLSGFFSPGPSDEPLELVLPNGQAVHSDVGARLLASQRALRSALRADSSDPRASESVAGLRSVPLYMEYGGGFAAPLLVGALQALAWAGGPHSSELTVGLETLSNAQEKDGTWPKVEFFFVLETLLEIKHPQAVQMLRRSLPRLLESQLKNGSWGRRHAAAQTWIGVQVLEVAGLRDRRPTAARR